MGEHRSLRRLEIPRLGDLSGEAKRGWQVWFIALWVCIEVTTGKIRKPYTEQKLCFRKAETRVAGFDFSHFFGFD
jgi:hypothetical protein